MRSFLNRVLKREACGVSTPWDGLAVRERYKRSMEAGERGFQKLFGAKKPATASGQVFYDLCLAELDWRRQLLSTDCFASREAFLAELRRLVAEPVHPSSPPYSEEGYFKSQRTDIEVDIYNLTLHEKT